ncbi:hypothetical protein RKD56_000970 [Priestia megaterium]
MSVSVYDKLEEKIEDLKEILREVDTEWLLIKVANEFGVTTTAGLNDNIFSKTKLSSPFKQYLYLIGLLLSTPDKSKADRKEPPMEKIKKVLNNIVDLHGELFLPNEGETIDEHWIETRKVSMPVFLNYFNTNSLTYEEQVMQRIEDWFLPYSDYIKEQIGINVQELLKVFSFVRDKLQERFDNIQKIDGKVLEERKHFFNYMTKKNISLEQAKKEVSLPNTLELGRQVHLLHQIEIKDLIEQFGEKEAQSFIKLFSMIREEKGFHYYTEQNPFEVAPIWRKSEKLLFVPMYKQLIHAIQLQLTSLIESSEHRNSFYKNRDNKSEEKALEIFKALFKDSAKYYTSVFENDKSQNEHDLVIEYGEIILVVEIKASKVKEPFRDPEKAYKRIKRDFKSDGGIQKAYDQGLNLKKLLTKSEQTTLYDSTGNEIVRFEREEIKKIYIVAITAENMGILATNLSYLLEKPDDEAYPWACNLFDLETALNGLIYTGGKANTFLKYLEEREETHKYLLASDELEIMGYFIENGSLLNLKPNEYNMIGFDPDYSSIFDRIYFEKKGFHTKGRYIPQNLYQVSKSSKAKKTKKDVKKKRKQSKKSKKVNRKR